MKTLFRTLLTLALVALVAPAALAQDSEGPEFRGDETPDMTAADAAALALELAAYGRMNDAPEALIAAARILIDVNASEGEIEETRAMWESMSPEEKAEKIDSLTPEEREALRVQREEKKPWWKFWGN